MALVLLTGRPQVLPLSKELRVMAEASDGSDIKAKTAAEDGKVTE